MITSQHSQRVVRLHFQDESLSLDTMANKFKLAHHPILYLESFWHPYLVPSCDFARTQILLYALQILIREAHSFWSCSQSLRCAVRRPDAVPPPVVVAESGRIREFEAVIGFEKTAF